MKSDIRLCVPVTKAGRHTRPLPGSFPFQDEWFARIHLDISGLLAFCNGHTYLWTCVDRFSCWCESLPMSDITSETTVNTFISRWVTRFGVPVVITTDRGRQFEFGLFKQLMKLLGCKRIRTTAYHSEANRLVERFHRTLKSALRTLIDQPKWLGYLTLVLLGLRTAVKDEMQCSPAEMVYDTILRLLGQLFFQPPQICV